MAAETFSFFSRPHLAALGLVAAVNIILYFTRHGLRKQRIKRSISLFLAGLLFILDVSLHGWEALNGIWDVRNSLPLHLCSISQILCIVMLATRKYGIYEITYFWGLGGATQALLTPDLAFSYPHLVFFLFTGSHALIVTACLWMTLVEGYRPQFKSLFKAFASLNLYMLFVAVINTVLGSNYLYICQKPGSPSILDYLGPWPWYLLTLEAVAFAVFLLFYLPFSGTIKKGNPIKESL